MITAHKAIYIFFLGSGIYHKLHSIFKSKSYQFHNRNIGLFSGNDTRMAGYFIGMHRDLYMRKSFLATVSSAELNNMVLNSKLSKVVSYIQDKKAWERIYVLLKIMFSLSTYPSTCKQQQSRNGQGIILFQNDKVVHNQIIK